MKKLYSEFALVLAALLTAAGSARADSVTGDFIFAYNDVNVGLFAVPSVGEITLVLNTNGTIAASTESSLPISGLAIHTDSFLNESSYSRPNAETAGWYTGIGSQYNTGFRCQIDCGTSINWTIGMPGQFSSVTQILDGASRFDFVLLARDAGIFTSFYANAVMSAVPEPSTDAMLLGGLGLVGFIASRRKKRV